MTKTITSILLICFSSMLFTNCRKKAFDEYYGRPDSLTDPIYQQLTTRKNFTSLLQCIDKAGYKSILSSAGYWTMFAPNDSAFQNYFREKNISGISALDSISAQAIIQYLLVYNAFNKDRLDDFQSVIGWLPDDAFRRRTAYYTGFYNDTTPTGQVVKAIASNRNGSTNPFVSADNNNKYITYFTDTYFNIKKLTAADYNYFYPASQYNGFNVAEAKVLNKDIAAENGTIHEIDRVISPLPSLEEYIRTKPEYSEFRKLYNRFMVNFQVNADATKRFQILTGSSQQVYVKTYSGALAFSPNNENYLKLQDNDGQQNAWTLFVPRNDVLLSYVRNVILEEYGRDTSKLSTLPPQVIADLLNSHMWQTQVWPSKFSSTASSLGEEARFNAQTDVIDRKILSNGFFYGTSKVQEANVFSSVYARAYLNPKFSMMTRLLDAELKFVINSPNQQYTLFMMPDAVLAKAGYDFNASISEWGYTPPGGTRSAGEAVRQRLLRILNTSLIQTPKAELNNLAGSGIIEAYNGEYIKFDNNQISSGGTTESKSIVRVDSAKTARNGKVYYLNGLLTFADSAIGIHVKNLGLATNSGYNLFWKYLEGANGNAYNAVSGEITGTATGSFYTVFVPIDSAIRAAVKDGFLPGDKTTGNPVFAPTTAAGRDSVSRFIQYHMLNKKTVIPDGKESGGFETILKNALGEVTAIGVQNQPGSLILTDMENRKASLILDKSNQLSNRTVIHLINNYLRYKYK